MHVLPIDAGHELRKGIELRLPCSPVVRVEPILDEPCQVGDRHPAFPTDTGDLGRPTRSLESIAKIVQLRLRDGDAEVSNRRHGRLIVPHAARNPPSTATWVPVTKPAPSEQSH